MTDQKMIDYINQQIQQGIDKEKIKKTLLDTGWEEKDVNKAFDSLASPDTKPSSPKVEDFVIPSRKSKIPLIAAIVLGSILIGGSAYGYFYYNQIPEVVMEKMSEKMSEIKSLEYIGEIKTEFKISDQAMSSLGMEAEEQSGNSTISFSGASDVTDLNNPKAIFRFDIEANELDQSFGMEIRTIGKTFYLNLASLPDLGFIDLNFLKDQWIKFNIEEIAEQFELEEELEEIEIEIEKEIEEELSPEQIEQLRKVVAQIKIFEITEKLSNEKIEEVNSRHYKYTIIKDNLVQFITEINKITESEPLSEEELKEFKESLALIESIEGEIWIGKKDSFLQKITFNVNIKETEQNKTEGKVAVSIQFKNHNKPIQIEVPSPVKTFDEVLEELFNQEPQIPMSYDEDYDWNLDTDADGLSDELEKMYGTDPSKIDTDGDGYSDSEEVEAGYDPLNPNG